MDRVAGATELRRDCLRVPSANANAFSDSHRRSTVAVVRLFVIFNAEI